MKRDVLLSICLGIAWAVILAGVGNAIVTIASNDPLAFRGPLLKAIFCAAGAALLFLIVAIAGKNIIVRLIAAAGFVPVIFVVYDFLHRYHPPNYGEP